MNFLISALLAVVIASPDSRLKVTVDGPVYSISYDDQQLVAPSHFGIRTNCADFTAPGDFELTQERVTVSYELDRIKTGSVCKEATHAFLKYGVDKQPHGLAVEFYVFNNDVAFRYVLPKTGETGSVRVLDEQTWFNFPEGTTTYMCPQSDAMVGWKRTKPSYEEYYKLDAPMAEKSQFGHGYTFPCLFKVGGAGWVLVSETGVDSRYCGSRLSDYTEGKGYKLEFPMAEENNGNGTVEPAFALPGATPWRTITVGRDLAPIVETTIPFDVVEPRYESTHTYNYGKGTWSWILWQDNSINFDDQVKYIDLSAAMGFKYVLVDNWWDVNITRERIPELVKYANSKGIDVLLWYSSSGWWNDIEQGPINIMSDPILRKREMAWLEKVGVKGIKVDFFGGDKQETMRHYEGILSDADDHGLMVIFHGCTLPRGWERMYPNYVGSEAVRASENLIFSQYDCDIEAQCASLHPFIRNAVGCMEYGGSFLNERMDRLNGQPDARGRVRGNIRRTTDAFSLATAVIFQNPIQNFALAPNNLTDAPKLALDFLTEVPTTWDETRYLDGTPGENAVIARRKGDTWYVGAVNAVEAPLNLDVKAIVARLGGAEARVIATVKGETSEVLKFRKPLQIAVNDGAVIIVR